jgi:hypothetical protein
MKRIMKAKVETFAFQSGKEPILDLIVEHIWCWQGVPDRLWGFDDKGNHCKFKADEEPFTLYFEPQD